MPREPYMPSATIEELVAAAGFDNTLGGFNNPQGQSGLVSPTDSGIPSGGSGKDESMGHECNVSAGAPFATNRQTGNRNRGGAPGKA